MVISCSAFGCSNRQGQKEGLSFYRFLANVERRLKWIAAVKRENWQPSSTSRICSEHFISGRPPADCVHTGLRFIVLVIN